MSDRRRSRRLLVALGAAVVAVVGVGCSDAAGPTQEEYAAAADGVCRSTEERLTTLQQQYDAEIWEASSTGESTTYVERPDRWVRAKVVPAYEGMSNRLKGIQPPDGDTAYLTDLYTDLDEYIKQIHLNPSAEGGAAVRTPDPRLSERFASYGMEVCGTF